ncbi:MAG TPA: hypothetical protein VHF69_06490, partial [Candidatus Synoicihabitans sp.]|nr:hypothetical protein [Candidatus Synoicihabitans sp.]
RSGYLFSIAQPDNDGWVDRRVEMSFPATDRFQTAVVQVMRFPSPADLPLTVTVDGQSSERALALETTETIRVPLSEARATTLSLDAPRSFPLAPPDRRSRSFRLVNIDFE